MRSSEAFTVKNKVNQGDIFEAMEKQTKAGRERAALTPRAVPDLAKAPTNSDDNTMNPMYDYPYNVGPAGGLASGAAKGISNAISTIVPFGRRKAEANDATQENSLFTAAKSAAADRKKHPVDDGLSVLTADEVSIGRLLCVLH